MHDWKLSSLVVVTLPGSWAYHESQHRRISKPPSPWRAVVRRSVATLRQLLATGSSDVR
jgi:hypothetical protein